MHGVALEWGVPYVEYSHESNHEQIADAGTLTTRLFVFLDERAGTVGTSL